MTSPYRAVSTRQTGQSEPIVGEDMVKNSAGGYVYEIDKWARLRRFLVIGTEGGTFYVDERSLTLDNAQAVIECIRDDGLRVVADIVAISEGGRARKNDQAIFALALAAKHGNEQTAHSAYVALPRVCRTGTHLFQFMEFAEQFGGWGHGQRKAVQRWYAQPVEKVAYQAVKYRQREGWTHRDALRLAHPKATSPEHDLLFKWITAGSEDEVAKEHFAAIVDEETLSLPTDHGLRIVEGFERAQRAVSPEQTIELVREYGLPREAIRTEHQSDPAVQESLLESGMPMTALIRNLGNMTRSGLLAPTSAATQTVLGQLASDEQITRARVHPLAVLVALHVYAQGQGYRSHGEPWTPVPQIIDALDEAFYKSFGNVVPMGKRVLLALDCSPSMDSHQLGGLQGISARMAAAALAMVAARTEMAYEVIAFASAGAQVGYGRGNYYARAVSPLPITARSRLDDAIEQTNRVNWGGTDCALPMIYAGQNSREVDAFLIYTDNETWAGDIHPSQALREYRRESGIEDAALAVVAMTPTSFSIADPNDSRMIDVVGFDTATPNAITEFVRGV